MARILLDFINLYGDIVRDSRPETAASSIERSIEKIVSGLE